MDLNYATMGSSLLPMNPLVGGIATGVGLGVDVFMNHQNQLAQMEATKDYNKNMTQLQPTIYDQPGGYKQVMPGLKKGGPVKSQKGLAYRSKRTAGHVIPADKVPEAQADARNAGKPLARIPGQGSPTADDQLLQVPGAEPVRVSSGEAFVSDDDFGEMARMAGLSRASYQMKMYPQSKDLKGEEPGIDKKATGGTIDWNPPGAPSINNMNLPDPTMGMMRQFAQGGTPGLPSMASAPTSPGLNGMGPLAVPGSMSQAAAPSAPAIGYGDGETNEPPPLPMQAGSIDPAKQPGAFSDDQPTAMIPGITPGTQSTTQAGMDDGTLEKGFEDMQDMNDKAAWGQAVPALLSMGHNLFSRRVSGRPPMAFQPTMLDLNTEGLHAGLDAGRQRSVATAANNSRGDQSQSRALGIGANDQAARTQNSMAVQGVKNQENQANTQISNQAKQFNMQRSDQFEANEAGAANQWKAQKGQAITNDLAALSGIVGGHAQGNIEIGAQKQLFGFQKRMYDMMSGVPSSQYATPTSVFTGNKEDMAEPDTASESLLLPEQIMAMTTMYGPRSRGRGLTFSGVTPYRYK